MTQNKAVVTTALVGQRGRVMLPAQVQKATNVVQGTKVAISTAPDGTITIRPLWAVQQRLREDLAPLLAGHLPASAAGLRVGGRPVPAEQPEPGGPLQELTVSKGTALFQSPPLWEDKRAVFTARAVLAWLAADQRALVDTFLPHAVLPEAAATELVTTLARAGAHQHADRLLTDLGLLGVQRPSTAEHRATLAEHTALALELTADAARDGFDVTLPDALCAAAAVRLHLPLFAADLLSPAAG
ncbi:AbrB/MazE/SpoVT family DNA-binding domain-containing protein [Kitasatospora xanthocidica]|uniref:AbrB/MazE/SpoVT family DNA-binding domain-containing protein n=1 Tax=Kitasatospora xanthocidica TaxID=83382 RepID=UPI0036E6E560